MSDDSDAQRLKQEIMKKAASFVADPTAGRAAGYAPEQQCMHSNEIGADDVTPKRSMLTAWLYGIANQDLRGWEWEIIPTIGGGELMIYGRRPA